MTPRDLQDTAFVICVILTCTVIHPWLGVGAAMAVLALLFT